MGPIRYIEHEPAARFLTLIIRGGSGREKEKGNRNPQDFVCLSGKRALFFFFLEYDVLVRLELLKPATHRLSHDDLLA
jgi:hypothetical protein